MSEHRKSFRIKITHDSFGECLGQTRNLSPTGVFVQHPVLASCPKAQWFTARCRVYPQARRGCGWKW
jgi:hypothetical protein